VGLILVISTEAEKSVGRLAQRFQEIFLSMAKDLTTPHFPYKAQVMKELQEYLALRQVAETFYREHPLVMELFVDINAFAGDKQTATAANETRLLLSLKS
jgi:hypothetical protein